MENKNKLKDGIIFIENDLMWEERQTQIKISRWMREKRDKGKVVKVEFGKVSVENR